jgi:hypothetical protein
MSHLSHIALCLAVGCALLHAQQRELLRIEQETPATLRVEFSPEFVQSQIRTGEGKSYSYVSFYGAQIPGGTPGSAMIPYRTIPVVLSGELKNVRILEASVRKQDSVAWMPYPRYEADEKFSAAILFDGERDMTKGSAVSPLAEIVDLMPSGSGFRGTLLIRPVAVGVDGTVSLYDRIVVSIETGAPNHAPSYDAVTSVSSNPLGSGEWYKITVQETGMYKLDQSFFTRSGISPASLGAISSIRIFGNGARMLSENIAAPRVDGLREIPRSVVDINGNGTLDSEDYVLFFGQSPRGWNYDPASRTFSHWINYYTDSNVYFLTFGGTNGLQMDSLVSVPSVNAYQPEDFQGTMFVEEERNNLLSSGRQWYGQLFDPETRIGVYSNLLPGFVSSKLVTYRVALLARSPQSGSFLVEENGGPSGFVLGSVFTAGMNVASIEIDYAYEAPVATFFRTGSLQDDRSIVRLTFNNVASGARGWLNWLEILYRRRYEAVGDFLHFTSPDTSAIVRYTVNGLSSRDVSVFDVTNDGNVKRITGLAFNQQDPDECSFDMPDSSGTVREYMVVGPNGFKTPPNAARVDNSDIHGITQGAEMVIITPEDFRSEADRLANYRAQRDGLSILVINIEEITNEYAGGNPDPMAVRDFLVSARQTWSTKPRYVLLFGNGSYDYKNIRTAARNWIIPYESVESIHQIDSYSSDDHFARLIPGDNRISVAIGRLPANSIEEAGVMVDKIVSYESSAPSDPWRNRVLFIADDGLTSSKDDGNIHTNQTEILAQVFTPASVEKKKIYIVEFPTVNSSSGRRKPSANDAIIEAMNRGSLIANYTGHGNPQLWAHEAIFTREVSLPQLSNRDKLFLLVAATCDFARYDNPLERSTGELILTMSGGGAVGVVTSSRAVYSFENSQFNNTLYSRLFTRDSLGRAPRIGDAMFLTKQALFSTNDLKYHLLGDPSMRLNLPPLSAGVDTVNGMPATQPVTVQSLSRVGVAGGIKRPDGSLRTDFDGQAILEVFDSKRRIPVPEWGTYTFEVDGSLLYRGLLSVTNGEFRATVPIPKDVSYNNDRSRISVYAWTGTEDAVGFTEAVTIAGTDSTAVIDTTGPLVEVFLQDEGFRSGDVIPPDPLLLVKFYDQSGINTSTASVGHRMEATLSGTSQILDLTDFYRGDVDTYQSGLVRYPLHGLPEGRQSITVKAWDIYNNSSQTQLNFDVKLVSDLSMFQVFNFPNPVSHSTVFTFQRNSTEPIDVTIRIFTVAGRLVDQIETYAIVDRFVQIPWDARDRNGDALANGVYFYKVVTSSADRQSSQEVIGKLTMLR